MSVSSTTAVRVFVRAMCSLKSKSSEFRDNVSQLANALKRVSNSNVNVNTTKEWKREAFPLGVRIADIEHPHTYKNSFSEIRVTHLAQLNKSDLVREIKANPRLIGKPMTSEDIPAFFRQIGNPDAF